MLEPDSKFLVVALLVLAVGLVVLMLRFRRWFVAGPATVITIVLAMTAGMAVVNDFYGYYQTWGQLSDDLSGSIGHLDSASAARRGSVAEGRGRLESIMIDGPRTHIRRSALVYLPPQYFEPQFAHTRFPVVELIHGTPGQPSFWTIHLHATQTLDRLMAHRLGGPMVLVMPTMSVGFHYEECVDAPGAPDDTYMTADVRTVVTQEFRVSATPAEWGVAGLSSGGYCAANLALRHPDQWGAAGIMSGYFRPQDGPAAKALGYQQAAEDANDPLLEATHLSSSAAPLPAFWVSAGTGDGADIKTAEAFATALHGVEQVTLYRQPGQGHTVYAWGSALPYMLGWMWQQLADPTLRTDFPISGPVTNGSIVAPTGKSPLDDPSSSASPADRPSGAPSSGAPSSRAPGATSSSAASAAGATSTGVTVRR